MNKKKQRNPFVKYMGIGMQMLAPILLGTLGGVKLDEKFETENLWTIILSLLGVFSGLYLSLKELIRNNND